MGQETIYKKLEPGTLVRVNRLSEYGIVLKAKVYWDPMFDVCYEVFVKGETVSAYGEGITIIGET